MKSVNSLCGIYAELIEHELQKLDPDSNKITEWLDFIKTHCHSTATAKGEVPEQLKPYLIKEGEGKGITGTTIYKGKRIPTVAKHVADVSKRKN